MLRHRGHEFLPAFLLHIPWPRRAIDRIDHLFGRIEAVETGQRRVGAQQLAVGCCAVNADGRIVEQAADLRFRLAQLLLAGCLFRDVGEGPHGATTFERIVRISRIVPLGRWRI